jgi:hypothetical protein
MPITFLFSNDQQLFLRLRLTEGDTTKPEDDQ